MNITIRRRIFKNKKMPDSVRYEVTAYKDGRRKYIGLYPTMAGAKSAKDRYLQKNPDLCLIKPPAPVKCLFTNTQVLQMAWK